MATPRRMTIARLMLLVASAAIPLALLAQVRGWERRRQIMERQQSATRAIFEQARADIAAAGRQASIFLASDDGRRPTAEWNVRLEAWERRDGEDRPLIRASVSGSNGRLASELAPIRVETCGSPLDDPWLDRLTRAYRDRGWRFELVRSRTDLPIGPEVRDALSRRAP